jgi:hypothetical protein
MDQEANKWHCKKCNMWICNAIDMDYHENTMHPNFKDPYVVSWWKRGRPGLSPYD